MYYSNKHHDRIEKLCYNTTHIKKVLDEIKLNFYSFFNKFMESEKGNSPNELDISVLAKKFKIVEKTKKTVDKKTKLNRIFENEIDSFEKDRNKYLDILDIDSLNEYKTDTSYFKDTILRNQCPIIQHTLQNKQAKELDKYRYEFNISEPAELLEVVINITKLANHYKKVISPKLNVYAINSVNELQFTELEKDEYIVYGVIGGGIKSHFLFKLYSDIFPYRSRDAIWALWYLTSKKKFDCKQDSEFLMIGLNDNSTQQNFFYPYDLFGFYVIKILKMLRDEFIKIGATFNERYRFVIVESFLSFIAQKHINEINELKKKKDDQDRHY